MNCARTLGAAQRGAALLTATVFMLVVIALFGLISLRMAGTDVIDTSLQSDSVEALFLAESGAERALQRLASGIACDAVAELGTRHTLGRGDFEIRSSSPNAATGWCDVRVLGRVLLGGTSRAERTIDVSLQRSSGTGAWAVGDGGAIYAWSGNGWSALTPSPTSARLNAVHCVSSAECWAVGAGGTILHWTGGNWASVISGTSEELRSVACLTGNPSSCYAVGNDTVRRWNGTAWVNSFVFGGAGLLTGVSCTPTTCYAVRDNGRIYQLVAGVWFSFVSFPGDEWNAIHCLPDGECWVAGNRSDNDFRFARRASSGAWSTLLYTSSPGRNLLGIHCTAGDACWAVGQPHGANDKIIRRSSGNFSATLTTGGHSLRAIDCATASDCLAVGDSGAVQRWNGSSWSQAISGMGSANLYGIAFTGASGGSTQLMRWQEVIQ